ncbi:hypothetical protein BROOK1789C_1410 [Bathymodiolus brooksi thiotrophic gill symbiont]|nr:hypothetical protein BROOK1789C_1410 [Bathymodiolus brooksi thiotrophic gill symbiont]
MPLLPRCAWECILGFKGKYKLGKRLTQKKPRFHGAFFFVCFIYLLNKSAFSSD